MGMKNYIKIKTKKKNIIESFNIEKISNDKIQYNRKKLYMINKKILKKISFFKIKKLTNRNIKRNIWKEMKNNIINIKEIYYWYFIIRKNIRNDIECKSIALLAKLISMYKKNVLIKYMDIYIMLNKKKILKTIRVMITNVEKGPIINNIVKIINCEELSIRLKY